MPRVQAVDIFCKLPSGEEQKERRYQMAQDDISNWKHRESLITNAAQIIRLQYKISSNAPPLPSSFNYDKPHKSFNVAKRMIGVSRDWFVIWMGFLSYIISQTEVEHPNSVAVLPLSPLPFWYEYLRDTHKYPDSWLDGLFSSTVCSFDIKTPRAGIIFQWSNQDLMHPPIDYFLVNHVPMYFLWTSREEQAISVDSSLAYLQPPTDLVQEALTILFRTPNLPLAGLVMQQYFGLNIELVTNKTLQFLRLEHATSFVFEFVARKFIGQTDALQNVGAGTSSDLETLAASQERKLHAAAEEAVAFPFYGMLDRGEHTGKLYNHFDDFFTARASRQAEIIKLESNRDRQRRESREQNPGIRNSTMYTWEKTRSSGGQELYMRVRVNKKCNEDVYSEYRPSQRCYNAFSNEWDFCHDFQFGSDDGHDSDSDRDGYNSDGNNTIEAGHDDIDDGPSYNSDGNGNTIEAGHDDVDDGPSLPRGGPINTDTDMDADTDNTPQLFHSPDVLETAKLVYGYVSPYDHVLDTPTKFSWHALLGFLGFVNNLSDRSVSELDERAMIIFFDYLSKGSRIPAHLLDLTNGTFTSSGLFDFSTICRLSEDLFVFYSPRSTTCQWVLGVHSAAAALYVCRYILTNPAAHNLLTVAYRLVERGIPFRTLLPLECSPRQVSFSQEFTPTSHRLLHHNFTVADFEASLLQCKTVLSSPQGRAALLRGGIVARIAKEYISNDRVYEGPSVEVTAHRLGYLVPSDGGICLCDDDLTEHEVAIICGTYSLYTRMYTPHYYFLLFSILRLAYKQEAVCSWFPPPSAWQAARCGNKWLDWTERCEDLFLNIVYDIRHDNLAPKSRQGWIDYLKGQKQAKILVAANNKQAEMFMAKVVPN